MEIVSEHAGVSSSLERAFKQFDSSGDAGLLGVEAELSAKPVEIFETIKYGNQYHGFTDPTNDVYDARSAEQSHASMRHFYAARLGMPSTC